MAKQFSKNGKSLINNLGISNNSPHDGINTAGGSTDLSEYIIALTGLVGSLVSGKNAKSLFNNPNNAASLIGNSESIFSTNKNILAILDNINKNLNSNNSSSKKSFSLFRRSSGNLSLESIQAVISTIKELSPMDIDGSTVRKNIQNIINTIGDENVESSLMQMYKTMNIFISYANKSFSKKSMPILIEYIKNLEIISDELNALSKKQIKYDSKVILDIIDSFDKLGKMNSIDPNSSKNILNILKDIKTLSKIMTIIGEINNEAIISSLKAIDKEIDMISGIIEKFNNMDKDTLNRALNTIKEFNKLVFMSAGILLLGALVISSINISDLMLFGVCLWTFLFGLSKIYLSMNKTVNLYLSSASAIIKLVMMSTFIMFLGSNFVKFIDIQGLAIYVVILDAFIWGITASIWGISEELKGTENAIKALTNLLIKTSLLLVGASLLFKYIKWEDILSFIAAVDLFFVSFIGCFVVADKMMKKTDKDIIKVATDLVLLVGISSIVLLTGSLLMNIIDVKNLIVFSAILTGFIWAIVNIYSSVSKKIDIAIETAVSFTLIIGASMLSLMIPGKLMNMNDLAISLGFAVVLTGFIFMITYTYAKFAKTINESYKTALAFSVLVAVSSLTLIIVSKAFDGNDLLNSILFAGTFVAFVGLMGIGFVILSKLRTNIRNSVEAVGIIVLTSLSMVFVMGMMTQIAQTIYETIGLSRFMKVIAIAVGTIGALTLIAAALVGLTKITSPIIMGVAIASIIAICGAIWIVSDAMEKLIVSMERLSNIEDIDLNMIGKVIDSFSGIAMSLLPLIPIAPLFFIISKSIDTISTALSKISQTVKDYATLRIPIYKGTKVIGYRSLTPKDFIDASNNVSLVISVLSKAISSAYDRNPELFSIDLLGRSKFAIVAKSMTNLGNLLSRISSSIKGYATLRIPIYRGTKVIGYRALNVQDFKNASDNISLVISILGKSIENAYDQNPEMFSYDLLGRTKFGIVTKSLTKLGSLIGSITSAIKSYANMTFVAEWTSDENGKLIPKRYETIGKEHFVSASENINAILSILGSSIIEHYNLNQDMYKETGGIFGFGAKTPFTIVVSSNLKLANLITKISKAVQSFANMTAPVFDSKGNLVQNELRKIENKDFIEASKNISLVLGILGNTVKEAYKNGDLYKETGGIFGFGAKTPFTIVVSSNLKLANLITKISKAVRSFANMTVHEYDNTGKIISTRKLEETDFLKSSKFISTILFTLGQTMLSVANNKDFDEILKNKKVDKIIKVNNSIVSMLAKTSKAIADFSNLVIPTEIDEKTGKPKAYKQLKPTDFTIVSDNIKAILSVLKDSIDEVYKSDNSKLFAEEGGFMGFGKTSSIAKVLSKNLKLIDFMNKSAKTIKDLASMTIPMFDGNGKLIKGEYTKMLPEHFIDAATNIRILLTLISDAVNDKSVIKSYNNINDKKLQIITNTNVKLFGMISNVAKFLNSLSSNVIPDQINEKTGKVIRYKKLDITDFTKAAEIIKTILTTTGSTLNNVLKNDTENIYSDKSGKKIDSIIRTFVKSNELIKIIGESLVSYYSMKIPKYDKNGNINGYVDLNNVNYEQLKNNLTSILTFMPSIMNDIISKYGDQFKVSNSLMSIITGKKDSSSNVFSIILKSLKNLSPIIISIQESMIRLSKNDTSNIDIEMIGNFIDNYVEILDKIMNSYNKRTINSLFDNIDEYKLKISSINDLLVSIFTSFNTSFNKIGFFTNFNAKGLHNAINDFFKIIKTLSSLKNALFDDNGLAYSTITNTSKFKAIIDNNIYAINNYIDSINEIAKISDYSKQLGTEGFDNLSYGISELDQVTSDMSGKNTFKQHTDVLEKYVRVVNNVNIYKLDKLINMTTAMNALATNIGNIDNFTKVLAEEISTVLDRLTTEIKNSKKTIENAEIIQKNRHALIEKSIQDVRKIMNDPLRINIERVDDTSELSKNNGNYQENMNVGNISESSNNIPSQQLSDIGGTINNINLSASSNSSTDKQDDKKQTKSKYVNTSSQVTDILNQIKSTVKHNNDLLVKINNNTGQNSPTKRT